MPLMSLSFLDVFVGLLMPLMFKVVFELSLDGSIMFSIVQYQLKIVNMACYDHNDQVG